MKALAFAGGGTLGILSSKMPWLLMRDMARWTQNWPWVPVPAKGKPSFEKSICGMCEGGCGIVVRKIGDRLVRIDGDRAHPVNSGPICPVGTAGLQMLYGPSRIKQPLRRTGSGKDAAWVEISWEEAIAEVSGKIGALRSAKQSEALACITDGSESTVNQLFERFLTAVGSNNFMKMSAGKDARSIVLKLMHGIDGDVAYDLEGADHILSFGSNLLEGWGTCGRMYRSYSKWYGDEGHGKLEIVQIDPNLSATASKASSWIPIEPGTDAALALGIAHVLIREKLYDADFVGKNCFGFDDWEDESGKRHKGFKSLVLSGYKPSSVERITSVPVESIEMLARNFAASKSPVAIAGGPCNDLSPDIYELMAVHSLNALIGNFNKPGGIFLKAKPPISPLPNALLDEEAERGLAVERIDGAGGGKYPFATSLVQNMDAEKVQVLLIHEANPLYALPDQEVAGEIFEKIPYIVSFATYMNESASRANLVLPLPSRFERWDDQLPSPELGCAIYNVNRPLIDPLYETKDAAGILIEIAGALGGTIAGAFSWSGAEEIVKMRAQGLYDSGKGMINVAEDVAGLEENPGRASSPNYGSFSSMWKKLAANNCWFDPDCRGEDPGKLPGTPGGKFEFFSRRLMDAFEFEDDVKCLPHYEKAEHAEAAGDKFDLTIMPEDLLLMADSGKGTPPFLIKQLGDDVLLKDELFIKINPITAMYKNLEDGDRVRLTSPVGEAVVRISTFEGIREGVVLMPLGFGHTAYDEFLEGKGVNGYKVIDTGKDSVTGLTVCRPTPGKLTKV
jgi:anaerobic selenocysteine-containing dehydrogenase